MRRQLRVEYWSWSSSSYFVSANLERKIIDQTSSEGEVDSVTPRSLPKQVAIYVRAEPGERRILEASLTEGNLIPFRLSSGLPQQCAYSAGEGIRQMTQRCSKWMEVGCPWGCGTNWQDKRPMAKEPRNGWNMMQKRLVCRGCKDGMRRVYREWMMVILAMLMLVLFCNLSGKERRILGKTPIMCKERRWGWLLLLLLHGREIKRISWCEHRGWRRRRLNR